jgi:hypothetical protein
MSKGPGWVQRAITELLETNPGKAWNITHVCAAIYVAATAKKHHVAVLRALRAMQLPRTWKWDYKDWGSKVLIFDPCSADSMIERYCLQRAHFETQEYRAHWRNLRSDTVAEIERKAAQQRLWYAGDALVRADIDQDILDEVRAEKEVKHVWERPLHELTEHEKELRYAVEKQDEERWCAVWAKIGVPDHPIANPGNLQESP